MKSNKCGAKTRSGTPCKRQPAKGRKRCKLHGGASPRGTDSPRYKHGLYSKYAGNELQEVLAQLEDVSSEELVNPDNEIKLMQALIIKAKALENGSGDLHDLDTISKVIDRLVKAKQRSQAIMIEQQRLVPVTDIQRLLDWMEDIIINTVGHEDGRYIMNQLQSFKLEDHAN